MPVATYVVYVEADAESAKLIAKQKGYILRQITGTPRWLKECGDVNEDGVIDDADKEIFSAAVGSEEGWPNWNPACDLNHDGKIDVMDLTIFGMHYGMKVHNVGDDPVLMDNNLIVVGGWHPNPYAKYYFYDEGLISDDGTKMFGEGVYADGMRYIRTITRANDTTVTAVWGWSKEDTDQTVLDYLKITPPPKPCIIATVSFGSPLAPQLNTLRHFRDYFMLRNKLGKLIVNTYYFLSPPLAKTIQKRSKAKFIIRTLLDLIIFKVEESK